MAEKKQQVLELLQEGGKKPVSGKRIAEKLGVTRAAVWKAVEELRADGYTVPAVTNRGYTLTGENDVLTEAEIRRRLESPERVVVFDETDSTNEQAKKLALAGAPAGTVVAAKIQTAGKGRMKRNFLSPAGTGAYFSVILRPELDSTRSLVVTAAAAVAVVRAVGRLTGEELSIKWVNDVYKDGKKVCGILSEGQTDFESGRIGYIVVGIGVNVKPPEGGFPEAAGNAGALSRPIPRAELIAAVTNELLRMDLTRPDFLDEYRQRSMLLGKRITVYGFSERYEAVALRILEGGELEVEDDAGVRRVLSTGEVSVRPAEG